MLCRIPERPFDGAPATWREPPGAPYLPLEAFRERPEEVFAGVQAARTFRSSGTTSASRARSEFSAEGLELYRQGSLQSFFAVLEQVAGPRARLMRGVSLVPSPATPGWDESSLAQMVAWIGELVPVTYATPEDLADAVRAASGDGSPVWVFGTAFHHVVTVDERRAPRLPAGSVVFETGGTKGRTRSVTRDELYAMIRDAYGVPWARVVSEYGMSELASQAYDWAPDERPLAARRFVFPAWVRTAVVAGPGDVRGEGRGMLLVDDTLRVDVATPLRIEDLVEMDASGFRLLGRAPEAPLKGCSLAVEEVRLATVRRAQAAPPSSGHPSRVSSDAAMAERAAHFTAAFLSFTRDPSVEAALAAELGGPGLAKQSLADLRAGMPTTPAAWIEAARRASGGRDTLPEHWLFVLPRSHGLVACHPAALAYLLDRRVTLRVPEPFAAATSFLARFAGLLARLPSSRIETCDASLVLGESAAVFDAVLVYGSDETVRAIEAVAGVPVRGYGHHVAGTTSDVAALDDDAPRIARDAFTTAQKGCLSSRVHVMRVDDATDPARVARALLDAARALRGDAASPDERLGLERESHRLTRLGFMSFGGGARDAALVATRVVPSLEALDAAMVRDAVARHAQTLPVLLVKESDRSRFVKTTTAIMKNALGIVTKSRYGVTPFRELGSANAPAWDGTHLGSPLLAD